ncbi:hypothetical protein PR002_g26713 [Phytophthora rubi]|uniref:Uncharacterized protein n=1 Tax=Phytophthora rubi TaxID=129364 RepID=A0A6A3HMY1_9STRA|nr:hypothetical protein PR002_g26713 [Phytophthora rubi]
MRPANILPLVSTIHGLSAQQYVGHTRSSSCVHTLVDVGICRGSSTTHSSSVVQLIAPCASSCR